MARAQHWWRWQRSGGVGRGSMAVAAWWWQHGGSGGQLGGGGSKQKRVFGGNMSRPKHFLIPTYTWYV